VRSESHRYIRYANGSEELYDERKDQYEWKNLAELPESAQLKRQLAKWLPKEEQPEKRAKKTSKKK